MDNFQKKAVDELNKCASGLNLVFTLSGEANKNFVTGKLAEFQIWLYSDVNADFISPNYDKRFEIYDYENEDMLIADLISSLRNGILSREKFAASPHKYPKPLLNRLWNFITNKKDK